MTSAHPPRDWADIDWPSIDADTARHWIAVLPLAATEQHGPHLPLSTDDNIAQAYLDEVRKTLPADSPATFLPIQAIGISTEHTDYPGTQTLSTEAALASWMALGNNVAARGIRKLVIVTSHGGNSAAMQLVAQDLRARHGMLAAFPDLVKRERIANFPSHARAMEKDFRWLSTGRPAPFAWMAQDLNPHGAVGDATLASAEKGHALLAHGARAFGELLADIQAFDLSRLGHRPVIG